MLGPRRCLLSSGLLAVPSMHRHAAPDSHSITDVLLTAGASLSLNDLNHADERRRTEGDGDDERVSQGGIDEA